LNKINLISIRSGLQSDTLITRKNTLNKLLKVDYNVMDNAELNLLSKILDYYMNIEQDNSLKTLSMRVFKQMLPFTLGYRLTQSIKSESFAQVGNLCRLYFTLFQDKNNLTLQPSDDSIIYLNEAVELIKLNDENKKYFEVLFQLILRFAKLYDNENLYYILESMLSKITNKPYLFETSLLSDFIKQTKIIIKLHNPVNKEEIQLLIDDLSGIETIKEETEEARILVRNPVEHISVDLVTFVKRIKKEQDLFKSNYPINEILSNLNIIISDLSRVRVHLTSSQISQYDELYNKISSFISSLNLKTKRKSKDLKKHKPIKDRMPMSDNFFD